MLFASEHADTFLVLGAFFGVWFAYYIGFEIAAGKTLGKFITKTRVIRVDGGRPSAAQIIGRTFARLVPFEPFSFLVRGNWHDAWSGTCVVRD